MNINKSVFIWSWIRFTSILVLTILITFPERVPSIIKIITLIIIVVPGLILEPCFTGREGGRASITYGQDCLKVNIQGMRVLIGALIYLCGIKICFPDSMAWTTVFLPAIYSALILFFLGSVLILTFIFKAIAGLCTKFREFRDGSKILKKLIFFSVEKRYY